MRNDATISQRSADDDDRLIEVAARINRALGDDVDDMTFVAIVDLVLYGE